MTFKRRAISLQFRLGLGTFGDSGTNTVTVEGLRVQAQIDKVIGPGMGLLQMRVFGLTPTQLNELSALNQATETLKQNTVTVLAGNHGEALSTVFQGQITVGQQSLNTQPETSLFVIGVMGSRNAVQSASPLSYPGGSDVAVIMQDIAALCGWNFENNGVSVQLSTQYLIGSPREMARTVAEAGRFNWIIDDGGNSNAGAPATNTLAIWPLNGSRTGQIPVISKETGMIGYPDYSTSLTGLTIRTEFNPFIHVGGQVQIKSTLNVANGVFKTYEISHTLESEMPNGQWMTQFSAYQNGDEPTQ
jgi:hypothetical protein